MKSSYPYLQFLRVPYTAGPADPKYLVVAGTDIPAELQTYYGGNVVQATLWERSDTSYMYRVVLSAAATPFAAEGVVVASVVNEVVNWLGGGTPVMNFSGDVARFGAITGMLTLGPIKVFANAALTLSNAMQDVPGATFTFTPQAPAAPLTASMLLHVVAVWDFDTQVAAAGLIATGTINVDGTDDTVVSVFGDNAGTSRPRGTVTQTYTFAVGPGAHTVKMRAMKGIAGGTMRAVGNQTSMILLGFG